MKKVTSLSFPRLSQEQLDLLIDSVCQEEGTERILEWSVKDKTEELEFYAEGDPIAWD
jgi:hypothetical protein